MRFMWCLLLSVVFVTQSASAQNIPVYNGASSGSSSERVSVYNSSKSGSSAKPLSIKGMLRGQTQNNGYSSNSTNTYNLGSKQNRRQSLLSMTPTQVRARQEESRRNSEKRAAEAQKKRSKLQDEKTSQDKSESYKSRFQNSNSTAEASSPVVLTQEQKRKTVFLNSEESSIPKPVFNSVN